ncbi:MAG: PHP domain-containing protein [Clostridium sp.]|nr:PHP domain-containing protein [Clostridium sp.]
MNIRADLHCHTTASDGMLSPSDVVILAKKSGVTYLAITDHDTTEGIEEAYNKAKEINLNLIPGIELSCSYNNESIHVLGYFRDDNYKSPEILSYLKKLKLSRQNRALEIIKKLKVYYNIEISEDQVKYLTNAKGIIARPHIAQAIINSGYNYDINYIFNNFIGNDCKAYVPNKIITIKEGIDLLHNHNCIATLAHPKIIKKSSVEEIIKNHNFDGIEAIYFQNTKKETKFYRKLARDYNLIITSGSDFHGISKSDKKHGAVGSMTIPQDDFKYFITSYKNTSNIKY